ncbi:MAG: LacI family DNA-binding transcriptional regulator [Actinomyces sp.]|uniref:LacI family DNA-binding transcriptional regulator n=1 Tax=Actinomyces sp. TaxID=29317 RepID=UPI0026DC082D|nr:LacI family DNA-binding transcriptional regulator [Actinomyces sp.]MDO4242349.1 LacI family DNA-binding transcriptional regulator [Actinomyces sp.]
MTATRADVARLAGVSPSTVTYVLTGKRATSARTRQRVRAAVEELGYHPNRHASVLAARSARNVGVLLRMQRPSIDGNDLGYVGGLRECLEAEDIRVLVPMVRPGSASQDLRALVRSQTLDAAVLMDVAPDDERERLLREEGVPVALIGTSGAPWSTGVDADFEQMVDTALAHLAGLGHHRILYLARRIDKDLANAYRAQTEAMGRVAQRRGVEVLVRPVPDNAVSGAAVADHGRLPHGCTAVVSNNALALEGLLAAAWSHGIDVPGRLSVVALGLTVPRDPEGGLVTEVSVDRAAMGRRAAELLLGLLADPDAPAQRLTMSSQLTDRASTAAIGAAGAAGAPRHHGAASAVGVGGSAGTRTAGHVEAVSA